MIRQLRGLRRLWNRKQGSSAEATTVFIFAACWRTGSTLLQRVVNASGEVFIWGEPTFLPEARKLFERTQTHLEKVEGNRKVAFRNAVGSWIPTVSPAPERAAVACRDFFSGLYLQETEAQGVGRWGFKEVRGEAVANMLFLQALWPQARFLFLVRDPYDTFRSVKGKKFHANFKDPMKPVQIWSDNVAEYLDNQQSIERSLLVRYEDLVRQSRSEHELLAEIAKFLGLSVNERMFLELEARADPSGQSVDISAEEQAEITQTAGAAASRLGYALR